MRSPSTLVLLAVLLASLSGCSRGGQPSADYAQARERWTELLRERLDEAASDPRADEVLELLGRVEPTSSDAPFALELRKQIEAGRAEADSRQAETAANLEKAREALRAPVAGDFAPAPVPSEPEPPTEPAAPAAAKVDETQPVDGMAAPEFQQKFSRCFEYRGDALVGGLQGGKVYGLKDLSICRDLHPGFLANSVLVFDGKIAVRPSAELAPQKYELIDGRLVPEAEARAAREKKAAEAKAAAALAAP